MSFIKKWWLVAVSLIIGVSIYFIFRQKVYFIEFIFGRQYCFYSHYDSHHPLFYFIVYCLPDGLWYLALLNTNDLIAKRWSTRVTKSAAILDLLVVFIPFLLEIGQSIGYIVGTFDFWDLLTYGFILILYYLWIKKK